MTLPSLIPDDGLTESLLCAALARMIRTSFVREAESRKISDPETADNETDAAGGDTDSERRQVRGTVVS